jgi:squalene-hopene/tetraprenyl-beta-curcumene cyclase
MKVDPAVLDRTLQNACKQLLAARGPHGHWEGELASSPLSTATAAFALTVVDQRLGSRHRDIVDRGMAWLVQSQNDDGGWGDTTVSFSNISTTALAWATVALLDRDGERRQSRERAERWLEQAAGSLAPHDLVQAISNRYGKDRTFSIPILSMLALAGCLGDERTAWRLVSQLPFELGACPHAWFTWLRLPVVSYALPALIALGHLRHQRRPSKNPLLRAVRSAITQRVLRKLLAIQPREGGFLEATPLTSFVVMSLAASGQAGHPVVERGVEFLARSQRADGSWPIDTNLATWVTTLSVNALAVGCKPLEQLSELDRTRISSWLLNQQYQHEHPYTHAAPGGWSWTDLPGGVPDADDTPGALLAMKALACGGDEERRAAAKGLAWLVNLQNRDGGIPTFCRGWGALPFDRSSPDLTAHTVRALEEWRPLWDPRRQNRYATALNRMVRYLMRVQRSDGAWPPLWFGNQHAPSEQNLTYGTSRVICAAASGFSPALDLAWSSAVVSGCQWLLSCQNEDGGWGGARYTPSSIEETSLALEGLASLAPIDGMPSTAGSNSANQCIAILGLTRWQLALHRGAIWLCQATDEGRTFPASPIGLYFAKLWYYEKLYPVIFSVAALGRLKAVLCNDLEMDDVQGLLNITPPERDRLIL